MKTLRGAAASAGTAVGPAFLHAPAHVDIAGAGAQPRADDGARLLAALDEVAADLSRAAERATGEAAEILAAQAAMARDPALRQAAAHEVEQGAAAAKAVLDAGEGFAAQLAATGNAYLAVRAADVRHICRAAARLLLGLPKCEPPQPNEPSVLVAEDLSPADTAGLDRGLVLAIVTAAGSPTSHSAIVARGLGIPAVVAVRGLLDEFSSNPAPVVAVDGDRGEVTLDPDAATVARMGTARAAREASRSAARARAGTGAVTTLDGARVEVAANIRGVEELRAALDEGAEAVGLLRTELLYVDRDRPPTVADQAATLRDLRALLGGRRLVVRTFDIGSDKAVPFLPARPEKNPDLGVRGIRLAQRHPDLLEAQLRAVAEVADLGPTAVMAPMVATVEEAEWFVEQVGKAGLAGRVEVGVMIEVPAAVLSAEVIAQRVDFLSIGTNDLTQYLMAADRRNADLVGLNDPFHPVVLRAVELVCEGARGRAWVGVCGEAASRPAWALLAVGLGVKELSMQAVAIPEVRAAVKGVALSDSRAAAQQALQVSTTRQARAVAEELLARVDERSEAA